jgi:3-oxoacyl-[acyl-carrier protein] reductase
VSAPSPFRLDGKVALVTGAGRGIGAAIASLFAAQGASVAVANRTVSAAEEVASAIAKRGDAAAPFPLDLRDTEALARLVEQVVARWGGLDIFVHNAAAFTLMAIDDLDEDKLEETLAVNLKACFRLAKLTAPHLRRRGGGRMLVTSSVTGPRVVMPASAHYAASKGGVNAFIRAAALEYAKDGITVNGVEPGFIAKVDGRLSIPARRQRIARYIPQGDFGAPEDVAYAMLYLASPAGRYVTGQTIVVDGGALLPESPIFMEGPLE